MVDQLTALAVIGLGVIGAIYAGLALMVCRHLPPQDTPGRYRTRVDSLRVLAPWLAGCFAVIAIIGVVIFTA